MPVTSTNASKRLLSRTEAAEILGVLPQTLAAWAVRGTYRLPYVKVGRSVKYRLADIERFIESRTVTNSGEADSL